MTSCAAWESFSHGVSIENLNARASCSISYTIHGLARFTTPWNALSLIGWSGFAMRTSGSTSRLKPRPRHAAQAPCGLLKENVRGASSGIEKPHLTQPNFSEYVATLDSP